MVKDETTMKSFQIISTAGEATSCFLKAIEYARNGNYDEADNKLSEGNGMMNEAHKYHTELLTKESGGGNYDFSVILVHAMDHLMNAVLLKELAQEFINLYRKTGGEND